MLPAWASPKNDQHHLHEQTTESATRTGAGGAAELLTKLEEAGLCQWLIQKKKRKKRRSPEVVLEGGASAFSVCLITDLMSPGGPGRSSEEKGQQPSPPPPGLRRPMSFVSTKQKPRGLLSRCRRDASHLLLPWLRPPPPSRLTSSLPLPPHKEGHSHLKRCFRENLILAHLHHTPEWTD